MGKRSDFITLKWGLKAYYNCLLCQRGNPNSLNGSTSIQKWNFDKVLFIFFLFVANEISVIKKLNWQHSLEQRNKVPSTYHHILNGASIRRQLMWDQKLFNLLIVWHLTQCAMPKSTINNPLKKI